MHVLFKFNVYYIHYILHRLLIENKYAFAAFITILHCIYTIINSLYRNIFIQVCFGCASNSYRSSHRLHSPYWLFSANDSGRWPWYFGCYRYFCWSDRNSTSEWSSQPRQRTKSSIVQLHLSH